MGMGRRKKPSIITAAGTGEISPVGSSLTASPPKVHVVDDDAILRKLLKEIVEAGGWRAELHESAENFLAATLSDGPGCVLLDMRMPGMNGLECMHEMKKRGNHLPTVMVTGHADVDLAVKAMKHGALDFLEKPVVVARVLEVVQVAIALSQREFSDRQTQTRREERLESLTQRERQVLDRIVLGEINKSVAKRLGISEKTVEVHRARVMSKLDAKSLADLIRIVRGGEPEPKPADPGETAAFVVPLRAKATH